MERPSSGVITDFQIDVISSSNVIVDEKAYGVTTDNVDVLLGDARVIDLTVVPYDTEATLSVTDTVVIVYSETGGLKIAKDIYIVDRYDTLGVADLQDTTADTIKANTYVNGSVTLGAALTVESGAVLYIDGNLNTGAQTVAVEGTLIVSGNVTGGAVTLGDKATLVVKDSASFDPETVLTGADAGATVTFGTTVSSYTGTTAKFYTDAGADESSDSAGDGTAATEVSGTIAAGTYKYGTVFTNVNGTTAHGWVKA